MQEGKQNSLRPFKVKDWNLRHNITFPHISRSERILGPSSKSRVWGTYMDPGTMAQVWVWEGVKQEANNTITMVILCIPGDTCHVLVLVLHVCCLSQIIVLFLGIQCILISWVLKIALHTYFLMLVAKKHKKDRQLIMEARFL